MEYITKHLYFSIYIYVPYTAKKTEVITLKELCSEHILTYFIYIYIYRIN